MAAEDMARPVGPGSSPADPNPSVSAHSGDDPSRGDTYRGWSIYRHEWLGWAAIGPNYDASWEGEEDGWRDNGEKADARTREDLIAEIDIWFEENTND